MSAPKTSQQKEDWKALRVESLNPNESNLWKMLWEFDKADWVATQKLIDDLNKINAPVQLRIVPNTD